MGRKFLCHCYRSPIRAEFQFGWKFRILIFIFWWFHDSRIIPLWKNESSKGKTKTGCCSQKQGEESYTWIRTKEEQMRDLTRNQSVRMRWVKRLNAWTWESSSSRLYATRRELLMCMGGVGTSNIRACGMNSSTRLVRTDLDFVAPWCVTTWRWRREGERGIELGRELEGQTSEVKRKMWGKGENAGYEVTKHL